MCGGSRGVVGGMVRSLPNKAMRGRKRWAMTRMGDARAGLTAGAEEVGEERSALVGEQAGGDFDAVVELGMVEDAED